VTGENLPSYHCGIVDSSLFTIQKSQFTKYGSPVTNHQSPLVVAVQLEELDGRGFFQFDAELAGDLAQGVVEVREVIDGHVADEGAANFIVARAAVQPAEEEE
jgi:hypothetical protein